MTTERKQIGKILRDDFDAALKQQNFASQSFVEIMRDVPSGLPHPDGAQRITNISDALLAAHDQMIEAMIRLRDFENSGIIPGDLQGHSKKEI